MIKPKTRQQLLKERGKQAYKEWSGGNLRGLRRYADAIIKEYGLTEQDLKDIKNEGRREYGKFAKRAYRLRVKHNQKEVEKQND